METADKLQVLGRYLALTAEDTDNIVVLDEFNFEYAGDDFLVLTEEEVETRVEALITEEIAATQAELADFDLSASGLTLWYNVLMTVDEVAIREDLESTYPNYLGCGTVEIFEDLFIFEL